MGVRLDKAIRRQAPIKAAKGLFATDYLNCDLIGKVESGKIAVQHQIQLAGARFVEGLQASKSRFSFAGERSWIHF
jgi:hypothetical protein